MDKSEFIKVAPTYYALAICTFFRRSYEPAYQAEIEAHFFSPEYEDSPEYAFLEHATLFRRAINWLEDRGLVEAIEDHFGPSIYRMSSEFDARWDELCNDTNLPFYKYAASSKGDDWLRSALAKLNETYSTLGITPETFDTPDEDWQPLPLDRDDTYLRAAVDALDAVVEQVRGDNGYSATVPEERNYVLTTLGAAAKALRTEASTNVHYVKVFVLEPLGMLLSRFKDAAIGIAAAAAKSAIIEFLKQCGVKLLGQYFGN